MLFRVLSTITLLFAFSLATAAASPSLGDDLIRFDLDKKLDIEVQFDKSNPKSGHIEFEQDNSGNWNLEIDPAKYHGPNNVDADYLFVDRDGDLDGLTLWALRKGYLPLMRSLPSENGEDFVYEFATPVEVNQFVWPTLQGDDGGDSDAAPQITFYSDIAGTSEIAPTVNQTSYQGKHTAYTLVVPAVRRIVLSIATQNVIAQNTGGGGQSGGTAVPEPASALLLLPGLAALCAVRRRRRTEGISAPDG